MRNEVVIQKMRTHAEKLTRYCAGYTYDTFIADSKTVEACVFNLSQIGELCRIVDDGFSNAHPEIRGGRFTVYETASFTTTTA